MSFKWPQKSFALETDNLGQSKIIMSVSVFGFIKKSQRTWSILVNIAKTKLNRSVFGCCCILGQAFCRRACPRLYYSTLLVKENSLLLR